MEALLPDRHPTPDFFVCDIFDALPGFRDDRATMEHPVFSLSTKPDKRVLKYEHNGNLVKIIPSGMGLATIHDKDVLLYVISYLRAAMLEGRELNQRVRLTAYDLLVTTNRQTNNLGYKRLEDALNRLRGTTINTNIKANGRVITEGFGLIDSWEAVRKDGFTGRLIALEVKLSDWFFNAVLADELLSINRNYFRLRKPLERRIYEIARKHCGEQKEWSIGLEKLKLKTGSVSPDKKFKFLVKNIADVDASENHFPDYRIFMNGNILTFTNNRTKKPKERKTCALPTWAIERAKKVAPRYDIYALEDEFLSWVSDKPEPEKGYGAAFIGFCKQKPPL